MKQTIDCWAYGPVESESISKAFAKNRIVRVTPAGDGKFLVKEMCDEFFGATLTAPQLAQWGRELIELSGAGDPLRHAITRWRDMSDAEMRLHAGEATAKEIRSIRAVLGAILASQHTAGKTSHTAANT